MMRFASLGSGSSGNALLVEVADTRILLDCGFGLNEARARLSRLGLEFGDLDAILITHEHDDHAGGVARLARRYDLAVYLTYGTLGAMGADGETLPRTVIIDNHSPFTVGDIEVRPYPVPHDAREPAQFVFGDGNVRLGVLTDTGEATPHIAQMLSGLDALMIECNHDREMLASGPYPARLKERIAGRLGHLDNGATAELVRGIDCGRLQHVIAAHLSQQNNTPELARAALAGALNCASEWITIATQDEGFAWREIG
jgi:phosphoribosyl 1,2-cyclic phosphodiesterase